MQHFYHFVEGLIIHLESHRGWHHLLPRVKNLSGRQLKFWLRHFQICRWNFHPDMASCFKTCIYEIVFHLGRWKNQCFVLLHKISLYQYLTSVSFSQRFIELCQGFDDFPSNKMKVTYMHVLLRPKCEWSNRYNKHRKAKS